MIIFIYLFCKIHSVVVFDIIIIIIIIIIINIKDRTL